MSCQLRLRLVLVFAGMVGISVLGFLGSQTYGIKANLFPTPLLRRTTAGAVGSTPLPIPAPSNEVTKEELLNQKTAEQVLQSWLSTKAAAFVQTI